MKIVVSLRRSETLVIYARIAHRLGTSSIKWELEDLAFFYLAPTDESLNRFLEWLLKHAKNARLTLEAIIGILHGGEWQKSGRKPRLWGVQNTYIPFYQKMSKRGKGFSEIYDLSAVRIITTSVKDCYSALGAVHSLWHPMPGRFKDYIAMPKFNMYQSLHTTVIGPQGARLKCRFAPRNAPYE